jgi:hypothetical protein
METQKSMDNIDDRTREFLESQERIRKKYSEQIKISRLSPPSTDITRITRTNPRGESCNY